jgi:predicted 3-demethylubiquinone-9 3-methyltransferase (glyoxalase superfamily)
MVTVQKITPCLWFDRQAEEAVNFYVSVFKNSALGRVSYYTEEGHEIHGMPAGTVLVVEFNLDGQQFMAMNGGPIFKFNEAISLVVNCDTQEEIDYYWDKLKEGGDPNAQQCGWLKDKFGLSWQVTPNILGDMLLDPDKQKANRAMHAMMQMKKLDIAKLKAAYDGQ